MKKSIRRWMLAFFMTVMLIAGCFSLANVQAYADETTEYPLEVKLLVVSDEPENGYKVGDEINLWVEVTNPSTQNSWDKTVYLSDNYNELSNIIYMLPPGYTWITNKTYEVTSSDMDILQRTFEITLRDENNQNVIGFGTLTVNLKKSKLTVEKKTISQTPEDGYAPRDTIEYMITIKNEGNAPISNIAVIDELTGLDETIESLAADESKEFTTSHEVTKEDALAGSVTNIVTVTGKDPDGLEISCDDEVTEDTKLVEDDEVTEDTEPVETEPVQNTSPKTGDNNHMILWVVLMAAALTGGISILIVTHRKQKNK